MPSGFGVDLLFRASRFNRPRQTFGFKPAFQSQRLIRSITIKRPSRVPVLSLYSVTGSVLQMGKNLLPQESKLTDATATIETDPEKIVAKAKAMALALWGWVHKGLGDTQERSMHEAARIANVTPNTFWKLRYRMPSEIGASVYFKLQAAYERHVQAAEARIAENLEVLRTLPTTPARQRLVAGMEEFLRDSKGEAAGASCDFSQLSNFDPEDEDQSEPWTMPLRMPAPDPDDCMD